MRTIRIYTPQPLAVNASITLEEQASIHIARVLRKQVGHEIQLFNGLGKAFLAEIAEIQKKSVRVTVLAENDASTESPLTTEIAIAVSKGDKMDLIVQKATELGVHTISPIITERSDVKLNPDRWKKKWEHWQQVAISACEQSGRNVIPHIHPVSTFDTWIKSCTAEIKLLLHPHDMQKLPAEKTPDSLAMCFGSEGGFSETEVKLAQSQQFLAITIGPRILRAETAPIAMLGIVQQLWGDFR